MLPLVSFAALAACDGPRSTLDPAGPGAAQVAILWHVMLGAAAVLLALVCALAVLPFVKRGAGARVPERVWLWGGGLALPALGLAALMTYAFAIEARAVRPEGAMRVEASARQWAWTFAYPGEPGAPVTDDVLHIPAGEPVAISVTSEDVIHSFWVPRLAGKRDAIPGRASVVTIRADAPGTYAGVCGEYCGTGHAIMTMTVIAHPPEEFAAALAEAAR